MHKSIFFNHNHNNGNCQYNYNDVKSNSDCDNNNYYTYNTCLKKCSICPNDSIGPTGPQGLP